MIIRYSVGNRAGTVAEVDQVTGQWMVDKRRATEVVPEAAPVEGDEAPRTKRKYTRRAPTQKPQEDATESAQE